MVDFCLQQKIGTNMKYKCSIYHPESPEPEVLKIKLEKDQVKDKVNNYPWEAELAKMTSLNADDVYCDPALEFEQETGGFGFCLRAIGKPEKYRLSVWYLYPRRRKILFGLLSVTEKPWLKKEYPPERALNLLDLFLDMKYDLLLSEMGKY